MLSVRFDESYTTVAVCSCGWRAHADTRAAAMMTAASHVASAHDSPARAADLRYKAGRKTRSIRGVR